jgi:hypothetical protein
MITDAFGQPYKHDRRHPKDEVLDFIMILFERTWCKDSDMTDIEQLSGYIIAGAAAGLFPSVLQRVCENKRYVRLRRIVSRDELLDEPFADKALKGMLETLAAHWEAEAAETGDEDKAEVA